MTASLYPFVIFDFDGTLADSGEWFARSLNGVARRYRFREVSRDDLASMRGEDSVAILRRLGVARWKLPFIARHMRKLMGRDITEIPLFPGADHAITTLSHAGIRLAVVSSNAEANVRTVLGLDLARRIDAFVCQSSLFGKAAKIRRLVRHSGVPPAAIIAIGDEIRDIDAAQAAGIACGAVTWGYADAAALRARGPTHVFDSFGDITSTLLG